MVLYHFYHEVYHLGHPWGGTALRKHSQLTPKIKCKITPNK